MPMPKRVMIIAGEASGDLAAAKLVRDVNQQHTDISFYGIGGRHLRSAGVKILIDAAEIAVVGLTEIFRQFIAIRRAFKTMQKQLRNDPPDLLVLVDYPGFNLRLAKTAKQVGVPVLFYISPQIWAWRAGRIKIIRERVDHMAVIFPFEQAIYEKANVPVSFVGHPLAETVTPSSETTHVKKQLNLRPDQTIIGLMPGSRESEIKRLLPIMLRTATQLLQQQANIQFILPLAPTISPHLVNRYLIRTALPIQTVQSNLYDAMHICDAIITASGTATLELALLQRPMVIIYKIGWVTYLIGRMLVSVSACGLCNIIAGRKIVPELIQHKATPKRITTQIRRFIDEPTYRTHTVTALQHVRDQLQNTAATPIDRVVTDLLNLGSSPS